MVCISPCRPPASGIRQLQRFPWIRAVGGSNTVVFETRPGCFDVWLEIVPFDPQAAEPA
jgi:hypothetical protein